ncbi:RloB family protein [Vibrio furnissii]|uniref:RloB family protein n=1 Tax=Vibrio furnissii TaxID=29494 RepID=UPI003AA8E141
MRQTRSGSRYSQKINPIYVFVAYEGDDTEHCYFNAIKDELSRRFEKFVNFVPVEKSSTKSQPEKVLEDLDSYLKKEKIKIDNKNRFAFLVIDRDSHFDGTKARASYKAVKDCKSKNISVLCTTPCFELWLILHYVDVSLESDEYRAKLLENAKVSKDNRYIKVLYNSTVKNGESVTQTVKRLNTAILNEEKLNQSIENKDLIPPDELQSNVGRIFNLLKENGISFGD